MALEILGFSLDGLAMLWIFIALGIILGIAGVYSHVYFGRMHPKKKFKVYARTGVHDRAWRVWHGKIPTELDIFSLILGKKPVGFPLSWFKYDYYATKKYGFLPSMEMCYVAQSVENRIFPLPLTPMLGTATVVLKKCSDPVCGHSDRFWDYTIDKCTLCGQPLIYETMVVDNVYLQAMKFNPEIEKRALYTTELDKTGQRMLLPLGEFVAMYDVGSKIAEAMDISDMQTQQALSANNPMLTVLYAALPLTIIMIGFGLASFISWQSMGSTLVEAGKQTSLTMENMKIIAEITQNTTMILAKTRGV